MFGFGKGDMNIEIEKYDYTYGDTIKGKATLKLKKPQEAKGVFVGLVAEQTSRKGFGTSRGFGSSAGTGVTFGSSSSGTQVEKIFEFQEPLDGEKTYGTQPLEYAFELKVPQVTGGQAPKGWIGDTAKALSFLSGRSTSIKWFLIAKLDVPGGRDVSKRVQINVG